MAVWRGWVAVFLGDKNLAAGLFNLRVFEAIAPEHGFAQFLQPLLTLALGQNLRMGTLQVSVGNGILFSVTRNRTSKTKYTLVSRRLALQLPKIPIRD